MNLTKLIYYLRLFQRKERKQKIESPRINSLKLKDEIIFFLKD